MQTFSFDSLFIKRFITLLPNISDQTTLVLVVCLLFVSILYETAVYNVGMISGDYYKILGDKDWHQFWIQTIKSLVFIIAISVLKSCKEYISAIVAIEWRKQLTKSVHLLYFSNLSYYRLNVIEREKDNLDQRITQDIQEFCTHLAKIVSELLVSPLIIVYYTYRSFTTTGYTGPLGCLIFFIVSTGLNKSLISLVLNYVYLQQKSEGDFRFEHMEVRQSAESIAFYSAQTIEYHKSERLLNRLVSVQESLILREFFLKLSVNLWDYLGSILSFVVLSFPLFNGKYDKMSATELSQLISQNAFVTMYLINCFTRIIDTSVEFPAIGGNVHRIGEVFELLSHKTAPDDSVKPMTYLSTGQSQSTGVGNTYFKLSDVSITVPKTNRLLIKGLNLEMSNGSKVLISGASGTSKTSILRVLKGIWTETKGTVERYLAFDDPKMVLFLPQKPVMTTGSLLEQISYPLIPDTNIYRTDDEIKERIIFYMNFLDLHQILERIDSQVDRHMDWNWTDCLSPGEQQRISFMRLFFHRPVLAVLDESTSALSVDMERKIYEECDRLSVAIISCGHRQSLEEYHSIAIRVIKNPDPNELAVNSYIIEKLS